MKDLFPIDTRNILAQTDNREFQQRLHKIEGLVNAIESAADPNVRASAVELMRSLMDLHGAGIERMMEIIFEAGTVNGERAGIIDRFAADDLVASLLLLHGLHPLAVETRVVQALDKVRPYLRSHGGNVELLGISEGVVSLKLQGSCNGCASSAMTLKLAIEEAIYEAAPDVIALQVEGVVAQRLPTELVQLNGSSGKNGSTQPADGKGTWEEVRGLASLVNGAVRTLEVCGRQVLFCRLDETYYAYSDVCPECGDMMQFASLESASLVCPACGQRFDVMRAGRGLDKPNLYLEPYPLLVEHGQAKIALPAV